ncbi:MAG: hypothetical protein Q8O94_04260 [bacterium]|nr:hypothetical protein [bacterium]
MSVLMFGAVLFLFACGGGGGGSQEASGPPEGQITCPDGSFANEASVCPAVGPVAPVTFANFDPRNDKLIVPFTGTLDSASIAGGVILKKGDANTGTNVMGTITTSFAANDVEDMTFIPVRWLAYGQSYNLDVKVMDNVGRPVTLNVQFKTMDMVCTDVATWSTPAVFSTTYQDCVAPIGVQTQVNPTFNTLQDNLFQDDIATCIITVGTPLTPECHAYLENGTMMLANTGVVVNSNATKWMFFVGIDGTSNLVLLDVGDKNVPTPVATFALPVPLVWLIGNPSGAFIHTADGKGSQLTVDSSSQIVSTCVLNCQ